VTRTEVSQSNGQIDSGHGFGVAVPVGSALGETSGVGVGETFLQFPRQACMSRWHWARFALLAPIHAWYVRVQACSHSPREFWFSWPIDLMEAITPTVVNAQINKTTRTKSVLLFTVFLPKRRARARRSQFVLREW